MPSNIERKARRKKQTRLTFEPIDKSSSPAHMSPANVRYQLPDRMTPLSSFRKDNVEEESDDELSIIKKPTPGKKNQKLSFKNLPTPAKSSQAQGKSTFDDDEDEDDPFQSPYKRPRGFLSASSARQFGKTISSTVYSSDGSPPEDEVITPSKKKKNTRKDKKARSPVYESEESSEDKDDTIASSRLARSSASKPSASARARRQKSITLSDDSEDNIALPPPRSTRSKPTTNSAKKRRDEEDSDVQILPSSSRRGQRKSIVDEEDSDELPVLSKSRQARASRPARELIELSDNSEEESEDEQPVTSPLKRPRLAIQESDDSDVVSSPLKRRRMVPEQEEEDSEIDLSSPTRLISRTSSNIESPMTPNRVTRQQKPKRHRTEKEKTMELLKRKRAGEKITELTESELDSDDELQGAIYDTDDDMKALSEFEDEEESPEQVKRTKAKPRRRPADSAADTDDHYDSEFVVEDDEEMLGVPDLALHDIPLEFTHNAHKPLKEHFKDAVEWMVHNKINPGFGRNDPVYKQAFWKLSLEYDALAHKFVSTQWTEEFIRAINARPVFEYRDTNRDEGRTVDGEWKCDPCNHKKHIPKFAVSFNGKAYNKETLEDIEEDSDSEDDDEDHVSVDENGHDIPPESKLWFSGSTCFQNALQAHTLIHWRHSLNSWVLDTLESSNLLTAAKLAARDKLSAKKRTEEANNIVDRWEAGDILKKLYRDFKIQLDTAKESMNGPGSGKWRAGRFIK